MRKTKIFLKKKLRELDKKLRMFDINKDSPFNIMMLDRDGEFRKLDLQRKEIRNKIKYYDIEVN